MYEVFPPEAVGLTRGFILGKHSGVDTLRMKLDEHGIHLARRRVGVADLPHPFAEHQTQAGAVRRGTA